jgi:hypothetical protein
LSLLHALLKLLFGRFVLFFGLLFGLLHLLQSTLFLLAAEATDGATNSNAPKSNDSSTQA